MRAILILLAAGTLLADGATKLAAARWLPPGGVALLPGVLELRLTHNRGMALGILSGNGPAIVLLPLAAIVGGWFLLRRYVPTRYTRAAAGLIAGGFLGNFIQRLLRGYVVDMLYFPWLPWFVCNVADVAICVGVALMMISLLFRPGDWRERRAKDEAGRGL